MAERKLPSMANSVPFRVLTLAMLASLSGCCSMARLFCGPDKSEWVPIAYDSPGATVATFLEAIRRDEPGVVYGCLSDAFRKEHDLDGIVVTAAWDKLREQTPGLHLLGYAKAPKEPARATANSASFAIEAEGVIVRIDLVRESFWELRYLGADGKPRETSTRLDPSQADAMLRTSEAEPDPIDDLPQSNVSIHPRVTVHPGTAALRPGSIERLGIGREWKIQAIAVSQP